MSRYASLLLFLSITSVSPVGLRAVPGHRAGGERRTPRTPAAVPFRQLVEHRHFGGSGGRGIEQLHRVHQQRRHAPTAPGLRRHGISRQRGHLRHAVRRRGRVAAEAGRDVPVLGRERRRQPRDRAGSSFLSDSGAGHHAAALGRGRCSRQRRRAGRQRPPPSHRRLHEQVSVRALQRLLRRRASEVVRRVGRVLRHEDEQPAAGYVDLRGCRRPRDLSGPRALRRGLECRHHRHRPRLSRHRAQRRTGTSIRHRTAPAARRAPCRWAPDCA